jgi:DNA-binding XRE family transcriptional regulator
MEFTPFEELQAAAAASRTPEEQAAYDIGLEVTGMAFRVAQLVYDARIGAGFTQMELAKRVGTTQATISQLEGGGHLPNLQMLQRIAVATGQTLQLDLVHRDTAA